MEQLELKYDSRFIVSEIDKLIPEDIHELERIKAMKEAFKTTLILGDSWDKRQLYLILMFIYYVEPIKNHIELYPNQHKKWTTLIDKHLHGFILKHMNFEYNAFELVTEVLNLLFII